MIVKTQLEVTGDGAPLVIIGGGLTGSLSFVPHAEALAPGHQVALAQPLGVQLGVERAPLPAGYSIRMETRALAAALSDLGWVQPFDLVGWSMGGLIALDFALEHPERIRSLVLVEPDVPWVLSADDRGGPEVRKAEHDAKRWTHGVSEDELARFMGEMLGPGSSPREHPRWPVWSAHRDALRSIAAIYRHEDDVARLGRFSTPVLLVKGEGTDRYNVLMLDALARALPDARQVELPGGHMAPVAAMDQFLDAMEAFQRERATRSSPTPTLLPPAGTAAAFDALARDEPRLRAGVDAICARHARELGGATRAAPFPDGSLPVYAVGEAAVIKLFPPCHAAECDTESAALAAVAGRLPVATPEVIARGELDGWRYLLMSRLPGESLAARWPRLSPAEQLSLAAALGECITALHALDTAGIAVPRPGWREFLAAQTAGCADRQRARGLPERWAAQVPGFLAEVALEPPSREVLLHTEIMREHLLVAPDAAGAPRLSGLFDFEPAMIGAPEYELASVGLFVTCGDPALLRALLRASGHRDDELGRPLQRRLLAHALLHRYSNLRWYLERIPPPPGATTLDDLASRWWAL
jgi:hygromycin-B 7''-O-kinase